MKDKFKTAYAEEKLVLGIAACVINGNELLEPEVPLSEDIDWRIFNKFLTYHELSPPSYLLLKRYPSVVPAEEILLLKKIYYSRLLYVSYLWREFMRIVDALNYRGVNFLPLKGIAFIVDSLYPDKTNSRLLFDIDILVKKNDLLATAQIIEALGYCEPLIRDKKYWLNHGYHLPFIKKDISLYKALSTVEIHWALDFDRGYQVLPSLWQRRRRKIIEGKDIYLLSPEDELLNLALHQRHFGKMLCLKCVCDTTLLLKKFADKLDWDYIAKEAQASRIRSSLYLMLTEAKIYSGMEISAALYNTLGIAPYKGRLIERFILRNTFAEDIYSADNNGHIKKTYLKSHFLLYDSLREPVRYIFALPREQFAKFYALPPHAIRTRIFYMLRYPLMLMTLIMILSRMIAKRALGFSKGRHVPDRNNTKA